MITSSEPIVQVQNLHKNYPLPGRRILHAVNSVNLDIHSGECLAIVGESGCGKTTLARMIARVEPVTKGVVRFQGEPIEALCGEPLRQLRRKLQLIFQEPSSAFSPRIKIGEFLREPFINYHILSRKESGEKAHLLLKSVGLPVDFADRYPHQLSGGELQRVAIARAMALAPLLLICDEPTSALDVSIQRHIITLLLQIRRESGVSMLFISHDLALVSNICDRVAVMYLGQIVESLPCTHLNSTAKHPYTRALLRSILHVEKERGAIAVMQDIETPNPIDLPQGCYYCPRCVFSGDRCQQEMPSLREIALGHYIACHAFHA